jgi:ankyrin repeat protein
MPKLHNNIYHAIIWRQNRLAMKWVDQNRVTIDQGLYRGAIQLLHHAVKFRNYRFARSLLKRGVDVDCLDGFGKTALRDAAQRGHLGGMKWLIRHGADFASQKDELLLAAVRCKHPKIIKWLLKRGCEINAVQAQDGQNPLRHCYEYCDDQTRENIAALLRRHGAQFPPGYSPNAHDECEDDEFV